MPKGPQHRGLPIAVLVLALLSLTAIPPTAAPVTSIAGGSPTMLHAVGAAIPAIFPAARDLGKLTGSAPLHAGIALPTRDPQELSRLVQEESTPNSPLYRTFLSPTEFATQFSPSSSAYDRASAYFSSYGLTVEPSSNRLTLGLSGTSAEMSAAFHTSLELWQVGPRVVYGPSMAPSLPSDLSVSGSFGLTNALDARPLEMVNGPFSLSSSPSPEVGASCATGTFGYTPCEVQSAYGDSTLIGKSETGAGRTVAVVDDYDSSETQAQLASDYASFNANFALPSSSLSFLYPDPDTQDPNASTSSGWGIETALDMEWSHVMAEGANVDVVFSPDAGFGLYQAVNFLVEYHVADVISLSWGEPDVGVYGGAACSSSCNASTDGTYAILHPILQAAAVEGISVFAASGDCGAADGTQTASTDYPASDDAATGVGGTVLTVSGTSYSSETAWSGNLSGSSCNNGGGAGGGWSPQPQPWYQRGLGVVNNGLRGVPDVGITAGSYLEMVEGGQTWLVEGTSDASPMWAGLAATADQIHGGGIGLLDPTLYAILRSTSYSTDFHDITSGNNGYSATPGWDPITGIGTPKAAYAVPDLARGGPVPPRGGFEVALSLGPQSGSAPLPVTFAASASGGTGTYPTYTFLFGDGNATTQPGTLATHTYLIPGSYLAWVVAFDSSGNSTTSAPVLISVGTSTFGVTLTTSSPSPTVGQLVPFSATPTGGTGPFAWTMYWGDGTFEGNISSTGATSPSHTYQAVGVDCAYATATDSTAPVPMAGESPMVQVDVGGASGTCPAAGGGILSASAAATNSPTDSGIPVIFQGLGVGGTPPYTYTWVFGDGSAPAMGANVSHPYVVTGTVPVTFYARLYVNDTAGFSATALARVVVAPLPLVSATATPTSGTAPLSVAFSSTVVGGTGPLRWSWDFGDLSTPSGATAPQHIYNGSGTFRATLTVTDAVGKTNASSLFLSVSPSASSLTAMASASPTSGVLPLAVQFSGGARGGTGPYLYRWSFGDGAPLSSAPDPTHVYNRSGNFTATLRATDLNGAASFAPVVIAVSKGPLTLNPRATPPAGLPPLAVDFKAGVSGGNLPYVYSWRFGDGNVSALASPTHTYPTRGSYVVRLYVNDSSTPSRQSATTTLVVSVVGPLRGNVSADRTSGNAPLTVHLDAIPSGGLAPYAVLWTFSDGGGPSQALDPTHTFNRTGTFQATARMSDALGEEFNRTLWVNVSAATTPGSVFSRMVGVLSSPLFLVTVALVVAAIVALLVLRRRGRSRLAVAPPPSDLAPFPSVIGPGYEPGEGPPAGPPPPGPMDMIAPPVGPTAALSATSLQGVQVGGPAAPSSPYPAPASGSSTDAQSDRVGSEGGAEPASVPLQEGTEPPPSGSAAEVCPVCIGKVARGARDCPHCGAHL
ncbi:MAG: PKD domain-containing protein [Euryarchaeota archaeon]|nr:PKD domain-containing protein [Euryarchaeota archaeon]